MIVRNDQRKASGMTRRVAILIESSTSWGADVIRGVARYAAEVGPWVFHLEPYGRNERLRLPAGWKGDGVLARVNNDDLAQDLLREGVPVVDLSWFDFSKGRFPRCTVDESAVGRLAAEHLIERGLHQLAYCPPLGRPGYSNTLGHAFSETAHNAGCACNWFRRSSESPDGRPWKEELDDLIQWLTTLPKPVGVLAFGDFGARRITEACWIAGLNVPEQVAVLGSESDHLSALISLPPLSSVDVGADRVGRAAAELLDDMMSGQAPPKKPVLLPPVGVVARKSTDMLSTDDELLAQACAFIRDNAHLPIGVEHIVEHVLVSRRTLEQRFMGVLGKPPAIMLRRARLELARRLLFDTTKTLAAIAEESGFQSTDRMNRAFQSEFAKSPGEFRSAITR